ncbi:hypothetical protein DV738_g5342, partial [Chaetothyriales sp. CBS 135597]
MVEIEGKCQARFEKLRTLLAENVESGRELGASINIQIDGETVVDIWGGFADGQRQRKWERDTIVNVWSVTKTITCLAALMLIDRGLLDPNEKVCKYWPEFAQNGKAEVRVRYLLSHSSGLPAWEQPIRVQDICDLDAATARLARQAPWHEPGVASAYNCFNMGHLVGELVRRITGKTLKQFVHDEIAAPLAADFQIGAVEESWPRIADMVPPQPPMVPESLGPKRSIVYRALTSPPPDPVFAASSHWRRADIGAANGHGNARSTARILSVISEGGQVGGVRLLSPKTIDLIFEEQTNGMDLVLGFPIRWGMGFALPMEETADWIPLGRKCFWGGWGGSIVIMDLDHKMTISYMMNKMYEGTMGSDNTEQYIRAIYEIIQG